MKRERIGFIGLGIMGLPMAKNLQKARFPLVVYNRTAGKTDALCEEGAQRAESPEDAASRSDVVITIVSNDEAVESVVAGEQGIVHGIREGALVIEMSTASPELERRLDRRLREKGAALVDAPVSGGDVGAQKGTLAIMAGGDIEAFERAMPVFEAMGRTITHCGPVGSGQLAKLCNQILVSLNLLGVCEAIALARANDLDARQLIAAVSGGAAGSWQLENLGPKILDGDFNPGFMVDLMQKDLGIVLKTANLSGASLPGASLVHQLLNSAQSCGDGKAGTQALARVLARLSGLGD